MEQVEKKKMDWDISYVNGGLQGMLLLIEVYRRL